MPPKRNLPHPEDPEDLADLRDLHEPAAPTVGLAAPTREHALVRRFVVRVVGGPDAGLLASSRGERIVVGTHRTADLRLADRTVSRFHCELTVVDGRVL